jgi:DNA-binding MurR/RpiR family transcriptional regulator
MRAIPDYEFAEGAMLNIEKTIKKDWKNYTPSEQKLATFFLNHLHELPFETAASIGKRVTVSPMTVGRYIKKLGYADLREIKDELRADTKERTWNPDEAAKTVYAPSTLKSKIQGLADVYRLQRSADWSRITAMLASAPEVFVASFQFGRFLGSGFSMALHQLRPRVFNCEGADGSYAEVLLDAAPGACLVLMDFRRYSRHFRLLAEEAAARKIRTVILTDVYCHWARALTDNVLMFETEFGMRSVSMAQVLCELLLADIATRLEDSQSRLEAVHRLRDKFIGFAGGEDRRKKNGA